jgi:hypothetical protein
MNSSDNIITIGHHDDPMRGPKYPSKINLDSLKRHMIITGKKEQGKSTIIRNMQKQVIDKGLGMTYIDPRGDSEEILKRVPESRLNDVIFIKPNSKQDSFIGLNILEPIIQNEYNVNSFFNNLLYIIKNKSKSWDSDVENIIITVANVLLTSEKTHTLVDLVDLLSKKSRMKEFIDEHNENLEKEFIKELKSTDMDKFENVLDLLRYIVKNKITRQMFANKENSLNMYNAIKNNKIIIIDTSNIQTSKMKEIIHRIFIDNIWTIARTGVISDNHVLFLDEFDKIINDNYSLASIISQSRSFNLSICMAFQQFSKLPNSEKTTVRQCGTPISLNPGNNVSDTASVAQLYDIAPQKISELDLYQAISYVYSDNGFKSKEPMKVNIFAKYPPEREDVSHIIKSSYAKYGVHNSS